jgi:exodeoxyribonuclease V alpha subunit
MTELFEVEDRDDRRIAAGATGLLAAFNEGGLLTAADVHAADRICALAREDDPRVALAVAVTVRAARHGSVCVDLADLAASEGAEDLPWPDPADWQAAIAASPLTTAGVLRREGALLYLDRFWREEGQVRDDLLRRIGAPAPAVDEAALAVTAGRLFPEGYDEQRTAALAAARQWTTVLTGGPAPARPRPWPASSRCSPNKRRARSASPSPPRRGRRRPACSRRSRRRRRRPASPMRTGPV